VVVTWIGVALPWYRWRATAIDRASESARTSQSIDGFGQGLAYWLVLLLAVTPLAVSVALRWGRRTALALAAAALALVWLAARQVAEIEPAGQAFVSVDTPVGAYVAATAALGIVIVAIAVACAFGPKPKRSAIASRPPGDI
jgi:hypothetical protein